MCLGWTILHEAIIYLIDVALIDGPQCLEPLMEDPEVVQQHPYPGRRLCWRLLEVKVLLRQAAWDPVDGEVEPGSCF